ncbi:MAG: adenylosuccinate synthetase [Candidatus Woesearchaeota archaeon]
MSKGIGIIDGAAGDGGKGKIANYVVHRASQRISLPYSPLHRPILVERFQGGGNAGHTIYFEDKKIGLHQIPAGINTIHTYNLDGPKMYFDPREATKEIKMLGTEGIKVTLENFGISANAHVTLQYHLDGDRSNFHRENHTSTGSGIAQTAADKYARTGIRFIEFLDRNLMIECLKRTFPKGIPEQYGTPESFSDSYAEEREFLRDFLTQEHVALREHGTFCKIAEGAQGGVLDVDYGLYPGTTSSNPLEVPRYVEHLLMVFKLYQSSVGIGDRPFVARNETLENLFGIEWGEFGTKTGRKRNLGWFDAVQGRYSVEVAQADYLVGTCGDKMEALQREEIKPKIVVAYKIGGKNYDEWDVSFQRRDTLYRAEPVFEEFEPWKKFADESGTLSPPAEKYVRRIEQLLDRKFILMSKGCQRDEVIEYKDILGLPSRRG